MHGWYKSYSKVEKDNKIRKLISLMGYAAKRIEICFK